MAKLKTVSIKRFEIKTDIELPAYFYYQLELGDEEYVRIDEKCKTTIKLEYYGSGISVDFNDLTVPEHHLRNQCPKEDFDEALEIVLKQINK